MKGDFGFASTLLETLRKHGNTYPVMLSQRLTEVIDNSIIQL